MRLQSTSMTDIGFGKQGFITTETNYPITVKQSKLYVIEYKGKGWKYKTPDQ